MTGSRMERVLSLVDLPEEVLALVVERLVPPARVCLEWSSRAMVWRDLVALAATCTTLHMAATHPRLWTNFTMYGRYSLDKAVCVLSMRRLSGIKQLQVLLREEGQEPGQVEELLGLYVLRGRHGTFQDILRLGNLCLASVDPKLLAEAMANTWMVIIEPSAKLTMNQLAAMLHRMVEGETRTEKLVCRNGSGDMFNHMEPSVVARALSRVRHLEIANKNEEERMSTEHLVALLATMAMVGRDSRLTSFSYMIPSDSPFGNCYPRLEGLEGEVARGLVEGVREARCQIHYILPRVRQAAGQQSAIF